MLLYYYINRKFYYISKIAIYLLIIDYSQVYKTKTKIRTIIINIYNQRAILYKKWLFGS